MFLSVVQKRDFLAFTRARSLNLCDDINCSKIVAHPIYTQVKLSRNGKRSWYINIDLQRRAFSISTKLFLKSKINSLSLVKSKPQIKQNRFFIIDINICYSIPAFHLFFISTFSAQTRFVDFCLVSFIISFQSQDHKTSGQIFLVNNQGNTILIIFFSS